MEVTLGIYCLFNILVFAGDTIWTLAHVSVIINYEFGQHSLCANNMYLKQTRGVFSLGIAEQEQCVQSEFVSKCEKKSRLLGLQVLRAFGAAMVFFSHTLNYKYSKFGGIGVSIFFVLSGFIMCYSYHDRHIKCSLPSAFSFSIKRIKKLWYLNLAVMIWVIFRKKNITLESIGLNLFLLKTWSPMRSVFYSMNSVSWYICDIVFIYLFFPFILKRLKTASRIGNKYWAVLRLVIAYGIMLVLGYVSSIVVVPKTVSDGFVLWFTYVFPVYRLGDFYIGCVMGFIFINRQRDDQVALGNKRCGLSSTIAVIIIITTICISLHIRQINLLKLSWFEGTLLWLPQTCVLVYLFAEQKGLITKILSSIPFLVFIGDISGYSFIVHSQILHFCEESIHTKGSTINNDIIVIGTAFIFTQMVGYIAKRILEAQQSKTA